MSEAGEAKRPWLRLWLAYGAVLIPPTLVASFAAYSLEQTALGAVVRFFFAWVGTQIANAGVGINMTAAVAGLLIGRFLLLSVVLAPLWIFLAVRPQWRRGIPDLWAAVLAAAFVCAGVCGVELAIALSPATPEAPESYRILNASVIFVIGVMTLGPLVGGALAYGIARVRGNMRGRSAIVELEELNVQAISTAPVKQVRLDVSVRIRERLDVINALIGGSFATIVFILVVVFLVICAFAIVTALGRAGAATPMTPLQWAQSFGSLTGVLLAAIAIAAPLSVLARIHRRLLAGAVAIAASAVTGYSAWRVRRFADTPASPVDPSIRAEAITDLGLAALPGLLVFGWLAAAFIGTAIASREDFLVGRGWRPAARQWLSSARRQLGMPNYVASLGRAQFAVTSLFIASIVFSSLWIAAPFVLAAPAAPLAGLQYSVLGQAEQHISIARAFCVEDREVRTQAMSGFDATFPEGAPLDACFERMRGRVGSTLGSALLPLGLAAIFALVGLAFGRGALRVATRAYQSVRERDARPPIVFLRAFRADEAVVPARPHSLIPRLSIRPGRPRTLDEIVLDVASPFGPVIAVGRPDEELPPLGAARVYAGGGDWQEIVMQLCDAAAVIVICLDATEGVHWELQETLRRGHAHKTILLFSPQLKAHERRVLAARMLGTIESGEPVGALVRAEDTTLLTAPRVSRASYIVALNYALRAIGKW